MTPRTEQEFEEAEAAWLSGSGPEPVTFAELNALRTLLRLPRPGPAPSLRRVYRVGAEEAEGRRLEAAA